MNENYVRPNMTASTIMLDLLPIMWSQGTGADVMKRIAAPMIGGMVTATILTLLVIPAIYLIWRSRSLNSKRRTEAPKISDESSISKRRMLCHDCVNMVFLPASCHASRTSFANQPWIH